MPSEFIHIVANGKISFFLKANIPLYVYHTFFSSFDGHVGYFHILVTVNDNCSQHGSADISVIYSDFISFRYIPRRGVAILSGTSVFNF